MFLPLLFELVTTPLLLAEFGENLAVLPRGLIDRQLVYALEFKLPQLLNAARRPLSSVPVPASQCR